MTFNESRDPYGPRIQSLWIGVHSLARHLGVKIDQEKGDIILLRESLNGMKLRKSLRLQTEGSPKGIEGVESVSGVGQVDLVRENLNRMADKLRVYREIVTIEGIFQLIR